MKEEQRKSSEVEDEGRGSRNGECGECEAGIGLFSYAVSKLYSPCGMEQHQAAWLSTTFGSCSDLSRSIGTVAVAELPTVRGKPQTCAGYSTETLACLFQHEFKFHCK